MNNLIAATGDNSSSIEWGGKFTVTNATSPTDGNANTTLIVNTLLNNGSVPYAAQLCENYAIDSQGNTPCQTGNTCYNDWFLPALAQLTCLYTNQASIGNFDPSGHYWSSTEVDFITAYEWDFFGGYNIPADKSFTFSARCVRHFTP